MTMLSNKTLILNRILSPSSTRLRQIALLFQSRYDNTLDGKIRLGNLLRAPGSLADLRESVSSGEHGYTALNLLHSERFVKVTHCCAACCVLPVLSFHPPPLVVPPLVLSLCPRL